MSAKDGLMCNRAMPGNEQPRGMNRELSVPAPVEDAPNSGESPMCSQSLERFA